MNYQDPRMPYQGIPQSDPNHYGQNRMYQQYPQQPAQYPQTPNQYGQYPQYPPNQDPNFGFNPPQQLLQNPVVRDMAMHYGNKLMGTGREMVDKELNKYVSMPLLRHYFAVDTAYVSRKLQLVLFPFTCSDWSRKFREDGPVEPRDDVHSPDLYIPLMAFVTYVLVAGLALGTQDRFSPDVLAICATQALAWTIVEIGIQLITVYISNITMSLGYLELLAFSGYKFVGISLAVLFGLVFFRKGYYAALFYCSVAFMFYLVRALKGQVLNESSPSGATSLYTSKRRMYFLLSIALSQPFFMWWLSFTLIGERSS